MVNKNYRKEIEMETDWKKILGYILGAGLAFLAFLACFSEAIRFQALDKAIEQEIDKFLGVLSLCVFIFFIFQLIKEIVMLIKTHAPFFLKSMK